MNGAKKFLCLSEVEKKIFFVPSSLSTVNKALISFCYMRILVVVPKCKCIPGLKNIKDEKQQLDVMIYQSDSCLNNNNIIIILYIIIYHCIYNYIINNNFAV